MIGLTWRCVVPLSALACACASSSKAVPSDGGGDATTQDDGGVGDDGSGGGGDAPNGTAACGPAPWVNLSLTVTSASTSGGQKPPIEGAVLTSPLCPGVARTSAADGTITAQVAQGVPFYVHFEADNYAITLIEETRFDADKSGIEVPLPPKIFTALIPGFGPDKTAIVIAVNADVDGGACAALDGVSFDVPNHPEAKITYFSADSIPQPTGGTSTTTGGRAVITELAADQMVTVNGTKAGCTVTFAKAPYTGRAPLAAGTVTLMPAYLTN